MAETADDILAHHGIVGMKWGKHKSQSSSDGGSSSGGGAAAPSRSELKAKDKASKQADTAKNDAAIEAARARINSGANRQAYKDAKAQYKIDKVNVGKREAAKAFNTVKDKNIVDAQVAQLAKSGKERTTAILVLAGAVVLGGVAQALSQP